jgi:uncharacterized membrane protein
MDFQLILGLILTLLPISELRGGLPIIVEYCVRNGISVWPYFIIVLILNIFIIFFIFLFLDTLHGALLHWSFYRKIVGRIIKRLQRKIERINGTSWKYLLLMFFVAIPLPGTGAWAGTLIAWTTGLNRTRGFIAIGAGVVIAGTLVLLISLGFFSGFY